MTNHSFANLNGKTLPLTKAAVSVMDRGFLYGDGVYETIRVYNGAPFDFSAHLSRLRRSASVIGVKVPVTNSRMRTRAASLIRKSGLSEGTLRIWLTRGLAQSFGFDPGKASRPTLLLTMVPSPPIPEENYKRGIKALLSGVRRNSPSALPPSAKTTNGLNGILAMAEAGRRGAKEALLLGEKGNLVEGSVSNVFLVKGKTIMTPALDGELLAGVTRGQILKLARQAGFKVKEKIVWPKDLFAADEVFISNAYLEALGVKTLAVSKRLEKNGGRVIRFRTPRVSLVIRDLYRAKVKASPSGKKEASRG